MRRTLRTLLPLVTAAVVAATLAGCGNGPADTPTAGTPAADPVSASPATNPATPPGSALQPDADRCLVFPHGYPLCGNNDWNVDLTQDKDSDGTWVGLTFFPDGTVTWHDETSTNRGTGTWTVKHDGTDTVAVRFDAGSTPPWVGKDSLSLKVGEVVRGCGENDNDIRDSLVSTQPPLTFEPAVC